MLVFKMPTLSKKNILGGLNIITRTGRNSVRGYIRRGIRPAPQMTSLST